MKAWQETSLLLAEAARLAAAGQRAALATVVHIAGSAYRQPGAKLLVAEDGALAGSVSGGCLETDVREIALRVMRGAPPRLQRYDTGGDEQQVWGLGLGCNGTVEVFVSSVPRDDPALARARELLHGASAFAMGRVIAGGPALAGTVVVEEDGAATGSTGDAILDRAIRDAAQMQLAAGSTETVTLEGRTVFVEVLHPPPRLIVCGAGDDAIPLAALADQTGFRVTVVDHRAAYLDPGRFPGSVRLWHGRPEEGLDALTPGADTFVVIQTHSLAHDRNWARSAAASPVAYIGLLGPRDRGQELLDDVPPEVQDRVYSPVGLDLGADGAEQIAVSVVSELLAVRAKRTPHHLRERERAIHAT